MYFPQIMKIKSSDDVLEIGPGAYPFWRSDCLADIYDEHSEIDLTQFGGAKLNTKGKPLFRIVDNVLPFKDNSFDYVICSHVFEHVPLVNLPKLAAEIMRVSKRAYIEFPRPAYDYIYNFDVHLNLLDIVNGEIICIDKNNTKLNSIKKFQEYAMQMRNKSQFVVDKYFSPITAVGAEFNGNISIRILQDETEFWSYIFDNTYAAEPPTLPWMVINKLKPKRIHKYLFGEKDRKYFSNKLTPVE